MADVDVTIRDDREQQRYVIEVDGQRAGLIDYGLGDGLIDLVHTETEPAFAGQGLAGRLVAFALEDARSRGLGVVPTCPYVRGVIARHPEQYLDLVPAGLRERYELPAS